MKTHWDVVILGGGFGGLSCARRLEKRWGKAAAERVLVVSSENYFVFQPLLPEVVGASLEPWHVINPIRLLLKDCQVQRASVSALDIARREVQFDCTGGRDLAPVTADHLVLALGLGTDMHAVPGMMEHALFMKNLADALNLRGHIIRRLEEAVVEPDRERRRALLHFVVVGGGYSGVETAAEILDLVRMSRRFYRLAEPRESQVTLVHSRDRLLPELDERLGRFAQRSLERRGMAVRLGSTVSSVSGEGVRLGDGTRIETCNVICTIGNAPHPIVRTLPLELQRGRIVTDEFLRVTQHGNVWAFGDCALNPDGHGGTCAPTSQYASRLGPHAADNIASSCAGRPLRAFQYKAVGQVATLGFRNGVCYLWGIRLSGWLAWWITRTIHLSKLPGLHRKLRVVVDWTLDLFFARDMNYLDLEKTQAVDRIYVEPENVLFRQGDRSETFYVIEEGTIELTRRDSTGKVLFREELEAGSHFGEGSLIRDRIRTTTAVAKSPARLLVIGPKDFSSLLASCSVLRRALHETSFRFRPEEELTNAAWPEHLLEMPVGDVMTAPLETIPETATLADVFQQVAESRRGNLPLVNCDGELTGMITRTDLYRVVADGRDFNDRASEIATRQVTTLCADQSLREALRVLRRKRLKHAPVVDAMGKPVGMLSYLDVALASVRGNRQLLRVHGSVVK
jgi:NADH dehydrogenase